MKNKLARIVFALLIVFPRFCAAEITDEECRYFTESVLRFLHGDDKVSNARGYAKEKNMSRDEFSQFLVDVAMKLKATTDEFYETDDRRFTLFLLQDFGTDNALDFLRDEAVSGQHYLTAFTSYCMITKYNSSSIDLAMEIVAKQDSDQERRRSAVYVAFDHAFCFEEETPGFLSETSKTQLLAFLKKYVRIDVPRAADIDRTLVMAAPEYTDSQDRRENIRRLLTNERLNDYSRNYLTNELAKIEERAKTAARAERRKVTRGRRIACGVALSFFAVAFVSLVVRKLCRKKNLFH